MKNIIAASALAATTLLIGAGTPVQPAQAADKTAQTTYVCDIKEENGRDKVSTQTMTLGITLDLPASVEPGQKLNLRGTLRAAFPQETSQAAKGVFDSVDGYSDTMSVAINGKPFMADRWQTAKTPIGDPMVVSAPISFPPYTVPNEPGGTLDLVMAKNNVLKNPYFSSPKTIAFTMVSSASGPAGRATFHNACYLNTSAPSAIAKVPIKAPAAAGAAPQGGSRPAAPSQQSAQGQPQVSAAQPPGTAPGQNAAAPSSAAAADGQLSTTAVAPGGQPTTTMQTAMTEQQRDGVYISSGVLLGGGALVVALALVYAAFAHYRLRALMDLLDD